MKPSLIQRQLKVNSLEIYRCEMMLFSMKEYLKNQLLAEKTEYLDYAIDDTKATIKMYKKRIKVVAELQKSLKKDLKFYYSQCREVSLCSKMLARAKTPQQIDYYEDRHSAAFARLAAYIED